jgi:hypothetical protein
MIMSGMAKLKKSSIGVVTKFSHTASLWPRQSVTLITQQTVAMVVSVCKQLIP